LVEPHIKEIDDKIETLFKLITTQNQEIKSILTNNADTTHKTIETQPTETQPSYTGLNYAQATKTNLPMQHAPIIDQTAIKARQILIDKETETGHYPMAFLTEKEIIAKAKMAIDLMGKEADDRPEGFKFLGTKKLKRGTAILILSKEEDAKWIKQKDKMDSFMSHLGMNTSCYQLRTYPVLTTFVPLTFEGNNIALRRLEEDAGLLNGQIASANWIKPPNKRKKDQMCGHMILTLSDPEAANKIIRNQIYIEGKQVQVSKLLTEPRCCLKCQKTGAGHLAEKCPSSHKVCGTCSKKHRTADCKTTNRMEMKCANCNKKGHPAWDRMCPVFQNKLLMFNNRHPENNYRYYPTADPTTWEIIGASSRFSTQTSKDTNHATQQETQTTENNNQSDHDDKEELK
jgi:hypothetical protein